MLLTTEVQQHSSMFTTIDIDLGVGPKHGYMKQSFKPTLVQRIVFAVIIV